MYPSLNTEFSSPPTHPPAQPHTPYLSLSPFPYKQSTDLSDTEIQCGDYCSYSMPLPLGLIITACLCNG